MISERDNPMPLVTICLPTYNSAKTISHTIESILNQSYHNFILKVVDNASTDETIEIIKKYMLKDQRVELFEFQNNVGGEGNFTRCIQLSQGYYTTIYHADDVYEKTIVAQQVDFLEKNAFAGAVFTTAIEIDEFGNKGAIRGIPQELIRMNKNMYDFNDVFRMILKYGNFLICPTAMVRTNIYKNHIQIWNGKDFFSSADLDVWLRILSKSPIGIINRPLINYRVSKNSYSYHYSRSRTKRHDMFLVLDHYLNGSAKEIIQRKDIDNYYLLDIKDHINRAISFIIKNENKQAFNLLKEMFTWRYLLSSCKNLHHSKYLCIGYIASICCIVPLGNFGRQLLFKMRFGKN